MFDRVITVYCYLYNLSNFGRFLWLVAVLSIMFAVYLSGVDLLVYPALALLIVVATPIHISIVSGNNTPRLKKKRQDEE